MIDGNIYIEKLSVKLPVQKEYINIINDISIKFEQNLFIGIIGESGCGKSILGNAIIGNLPPYAKVEGRVKYKNYDILGDVKISKDFYIKEWGIIPQNPSESLISIKSITKQMQDILSVNNIQDKNNDYKNKLLKFFGLNNSTEVLEKYPFELSGGMQQRVLCAMGISQSPKWILADEPTKGLDEHTSKIVYDNLFKIKIEHKYSMLIISHDLSLVRQICDKVAVMYYGQIVEYGDNILNKPLHPYTQAFFGALPENGFQIIKEQNLITESQMGCSFAKYCRHCSNKCIQENPEMYNVGETKVRCFLYA
ncbi:ABC transporter ATP-binding protein [Megamonas funiformis]|uniref:oligopeptide/dipeptide ABC transporter ATP-binding protein n=1 Tax=Megamonas funiformis TaxID=437897 RepID=UPI00094E8494|nr:ABC transporter ATP-binding protein [Megamonas funiformis]